MVGESKALLKSSPFAMEAKGLRCIGVKQQNNKKNRETFKQRSQIVIHNQSDQKKLIINEMIKRS